MKSMKRLAVAVVLCLVLAGMVFAAAVTPRNIVFSSGGAGGSFYVLMMAMMEYLPKDIPGLNITGFEGAATQNLRMLELNDAQIANAWCDQFKEAIEGVGIFKDEQLKEIAALQTSTKAMQLLMGRASLPINTVEDFKTVTGITFCPGEVGSGLATACEEIFKEMGFSFEEFEKNGNTIVYAIYGQFADMLADGQLDAFFIGGGLDTPHNAIMQAELRTDLKVIPIEGPWVESLCKRLPSMAPYTMAANVYKNQPNPVPVMVYYTMLACRKDLDENFVYEFTKSNYNNTNKWVEAVPQIAKILTKPADYVMGFDHSTLHPGAAKFWKEIGAIQ